MIQTVKDLEKFLMVFQKTLSQEASCYGLHRFAFVSQGFMCGKLGPQCDDVGRWWNL
jgi:hypothetical protein